MTLLDIFPLNLYLAVLYMKGIAIAHYYVSIFISGSFHFCVQLTRGQCGSRCKECLWPLMAWPLRPKAVFIFSTGNESNSDPSTVVLAKPCNKFRSSCRPVDILKDHILFFRGNLRFRLVGLFVFVLQFLQGFSRREWRKDVIVPDESWAEFWKCLYFLKFNQDPTSAFWESRGPQFNPRTMKKSVVACAAGLFWKSLC